MPDHQLTGDLHEDVGTTGSEGLCAGGHCHGYASDTSKDVGRHAKFELRSISALGAHVLSAQDTLDTAQASKKANAEQLASARRNFEVGTTASTDTPETQARFDLAGAHEIAVENGLETRRVALDQLVGRSGVTPSPLLTPAVLPALPPGEVEHWVADADARQPLVRTARIGEEVLARNEQGSRGPPADRRSRGPASYSAVAAAAPPSRSLQRRPARPAPQVSACN